MRLRIAVDGRERDVEVEGDPPDVRVTVEARAIPVHVSVEGATAVAEIEGRGAIRLEFGGGVRVNGAAREVRVTWLADETKSEGGDATVDVRPPMPGRVVKVLAKPGDAVRRGAPLLVLEAMKMQNEIPAPVSGTVKEIRVREGDQVGVTDILFRLSRTGASSANAMGKH